MRKSILGLGIGLTLVSSAFGDGGVAFLKLGVGARSGALGHAMSSIVDDASAAYWNPARLTDLKRPQILLNHNEWFLETNYEYAAFALPAFKGGVAVSTMLTSVAGIEQRSTTPTAEPLGTFGANDVMFALSYGRFISHGISVGLTAKYLYQKIYVSSSTGYAFDFGLAYRPEARIVASGVVQNVGSMEAFAREDISVPVTIRLGLSYELYSTSAWGVVTALELVKTTDLDERFHAGSEVVFGRYFVLRAGYQTGDSTRSFSGGFGLIFSRYHLDYAFIPFEADFGSGHQFSIALDL
jgi:hypothetical protein